VTFTAADGTAILMPAFWDGGTTWKVRFAPTKYGVWTYKTTCSDITNIGLNDKQGRIGCNTYKGNLDIYKHGFVTVSENKRYFTYADGTPFFYLSDNHSTLPYERFNGSNMQGIDSQFKYIVDLRVQQGFTAYESEPIQVANNSGDDPVYSTLSKFTESVLPGFANMDRKFKYIAEKGIVHTNMQLFFSDELTKPEYKQFYTADYLDKLSRYWVARYSAYPVMWATAQEVDNDFYYDREGDQKAFNAENNPWKIVAASIHKYDPYSHPLTAHMEYASMDPVHGANATKSSFKYIDGHNWYGMDWQLSSATAIEFAIPKDYWNSDVTKPTVNYDPEFDHFWTDTFGSRLEGWTAYLNGIYGYGYGSAGIWAIINDYASHDYALDYDLNTDTTMASSTEVITKEEKRINWYEATLFPAPVQLGKYMRDFFQSFEWWKLEPCFDDPESKHLAIFNAFYSGATIGNETYVVYFFNKNNFTGYLTSLEAGKTYTAKWYNPSTGDFTAIASDITGTGDKSTWRMPDKPDANDWVIYVTMNK